MARQDVYRKYDENGNVVDEVRFDEGTPEYNAAIEARNGSGGEVNGYYINRGTGHITSPVGAEAMSSISQLAEEMSPKIKVNDKGTGLVVSGSKEAVTSEMGTQLKKYLDDTFKYADLRSENVADAINKLNESLADQVEQRVVEGMLDVPYDDYKEYKFAMQQFQGTNPLTSTGAIPGYNRQGRKIKATDSDKKTVNDWLEYYMKNYTATERAELFAKSLAAIQSGDRDFAKWTPYLVMSGGGYSSAPIYGFSDAEKAGTLVQNAVYNAFGKLTESAANAAQFISNPFAWWGFARKNGVNDVAHALGHGEDVSLSEAKWMTEEAFNKKLDSIIGKNVNELTSDEQAFLAVALGDSGVGAKGPFGIGSWYDVKNFITEEGNDNISREQIEKATSYQDYINARDNLSTISKYSKELSENAENLAGTKDIKRDIEAAQIYAPVQSGFGAFAGTMIRFWIENGLVSGLTGGDFAPASLSDSYAESIMNVLQKIGLKRAPEALSKGLPNFLLRVVAEVPEDIVQTAIDDALTGHADEIGTLFTPDSIAENTLQNLVMRLAFTPVHAGYQWAKTKLAIQRAAKEAGMEAKAPDSLFDNSRKVQQAADGIPGAGTIVDATADSVTIRRDDGSTEVLDNVAILRPFTSPEGKEKYPREYEILRKKGLVADVADSDLSVRIEDAKRAVENGEYDVSSGVSKATIAPVDDPFRGYETPETTVKSRSLTDDTVPYTSMYDDARYELPATKALDTYAHTYGVGIYDDYSKILGKNLDDAKLIGALNSLYRNGDNINDIIFDDAYSETLRQVNRDKDFGLLRLALEGDGGAKYLSYFPDGATEAEAKAAIREALESLVNRHTKLLRDFDDRLSQLRASRASDRIKVEDTATGLLNVLGQITDEYGVLRDEIVDRLYEYATNDKSALRRAASAISKSSDAILNETSANVLKGIKKNGVKLQLDIAVKGRLSEDGNILFFSLDDSPSSQFAGELDDTIYHIPKGTKIASIDNYPGEYLVDVSSGMVGDDANKYVNKPNGAAYKPRVEAWDFDNYIVEDTTATRNPKGYLKFGEDFLEKVGEKSPEADEFYYAVGPGGTVSGPEGTERFRYNVNIMNQRLRAVNELGKMNYSKPSDVLDAILATGATGDINTIVLPDTERITTTYDTMIGALDRWTNPLRETGLSLENAAFNSVVSDELANWARTTDAGKAFIKDLQDLRGWLDGKAKLASENKYISDADMQEFLHRMLDIQLKYNNGSFSQLPRTFQAIANYGEKAPYKAKKDFIVYRGVKDFGRGSLRPAGELPFGSLRPGDDWDDAGFAYTSLNPYVARGYAGDEDFDGFVVRYHVPEGTPVIYFGNPEHFGNIRHLGDGGAIVLPRHARGKVVGVSDTPMGKIIDVELVDPNGNISGLKTPLDIFNDNFASSYRKKGTSLEADLDRVYGDEAGAMVIGEVADALGKADDAVTAADIRKFLASEDATELNYQLNRRAYQSDTVTVFRGQPESGRLARTADTIDAGEDGYHFTRDPNDAYDYGGNVVRMDFDRKYIANRTEAEVALSHLSSVAAEPDWMAGEGLDPETAARTQAMVAAYNGGEENKAVALSVEKPILERIEEDGSTTYTYIPGIDEEFDRSMEAQILASTEMVAPEASADVANVEMANRIQKALDTETYGRTIEEIVADKYKKGADTISDAPSSASYKWESPDVTKTYNSEAEVFADRPTGGNLTDVRQWIVNGTNFYMTRFREQAVPVFNDSYKTVDAQHQFVRNMDYLFNLQRKGGKKLVVGGGPDYEISGSAIGETYENEGITYTVNEDDVRFYLDNIEPLMQGLREAGAAGVGQEAFTITGYLPHSDYDPTDLTAEDSMQQGVLWREYSGASTTSEDGNFSTGWLTPDLEERYRIFTKNMLWDSLGDEVVISKFMEELHEDGLDVDVQKVVNLVGGRKNLAKIVEKSDSAKKMVKHLVSNGELPSDGDIETNASAASMAEKIHTIYNPVYGSAEGLTQKGSVSLLTKSDWMRSLSTSDGSLYDNGGAMIVNSLADAKFLTKQIFDAIDNNQTIDVHKLFTDYISQNHRRTAKGASYIADKWMSKIAQQARNGGVTRREVTATLGNLIYGEGANRVFRFIGRMDTSKLNASNKQALDSLLFRHSMLSKIKNTSGLSANLNKLTNGLISARMKSLFWLNYKNGVLQASECIRLFTEFKLGDAIATIKRLATDKEFRELVDEWVDMLVPERFVKSDSEASVGALGTIVDNAKYSDGTLTIDKLSPDAIKKLGKDFDKFANHPVEMGETLKNRILMAGILQEAERKGLSGNEQFSYVNQRFERIGLAANEMGRLNASDSPLFRIGANLKTFQIRQLRMFINNIQDANGKKEAVTYIMKTMGWKLGLATILTKLGYSASSVLGLDPFDLMDDDYTGVDEENYTGLDYAMLSPVAKLFLSGGFTSYIGDLYWAGRKAYEDSATVTEQTEKRVSRDFFPGWAAPGATFDNALNAFSGFIPGYTAGKRVYQMADLMSTGWVTSSTGNKMYQAPDNPFDTATGYIFGRSNTPNARAYYQTPDYLHGIATGGLAGLGQQISREFSTLRAMFGDTNAGFRQFDPTDSQNYSDWFDGTAADEQQWNSGYYYFRNRVDQIQKDYQEALGKAYSDEDKNSLDESFNRQIGEIEDQLSRFTAAYEAKHPEGIDARKMRNLTTILNLYQPVMSDTAEERRQRELNANSEALYRYAQAGLPAVTSYSRNKDTGEVEPLYSPQLRSALQGEYGLPKEAATQIRQLYNDKWKDLGQRYRDMLFSAKGTKNKQAIQREYINIVRQDLDPIVRLYGNNIWNNEDVENIIDDVFNSMIPKYGQSAKSYLKELYKGYSGEIRYNESGNQVIAQIDGLLNQGRTAQAKALARSLLQRVQENRTSLTREELEKLQRILND